MKPYELKRFYHPRVGKFVYKHKGSAIIIVNIFKPMKAIATLGTRGFSCAVSGFESSK